MEAKELTTQELRIGNTIEYNGIIKTIFSINKKGFVTFETDPIEVGKQKYEQSPSIHISYFKPIELTEQWLLKFELEVIDDNPKKKPHYEGDIIFKIKLDDYFVFEFSNSMSDGFVCYNLGSLKIKYAHQLQNLYFALTGTELTLNQ